MYKLIPLSEAIMDKEFYTLTELAEMFEVTRTTIHNWNNDGRFPHYITVGNKDTVLVPASDVTAVRKEEAEKLLSQITRLGYRVEVTAA
jgi:predicted DNA-binding transcriptional regulator AlpA